jgi:DNA-binding LytR/AlgR family response regulator
MIQVLIIEDEAPAFRRLDNLLREHENDFDVLEVIDSVEDSVKWLRNHKCPDLIFSDIQLADGLSFEIFEKVGIDCPIIFTTAYDEYMLNAFRTNGIDYLLKPIAPEDLARSIQKFKSLGGNSVDPKLENLIDDLKNPKPKYRSRFLVRLGDKLIPSKVEDIAYFKSTEGATEMVRKSGKAYIVDQPLDELEKQLDPNAFFRLNRQFLASNDSIGILHRYFNGKLKVELVPDPETEVLVSREKAAKFKSWLDGED